MSEPVAYVSTYRIKEGRFGDYERFYEQLVRAVEANEPRVAAFLAFADPEGTEMTFVHVFPDARALDHHMVVLAEQMGLLPDDLKAVFEVMEPIRIDVYGQPGGEAAALDHGMMDSGVPFTSKPRYLGGFTRAPSA